MNRKAGDLVNQVPIAGFRELYKKAYKDTRNPLFAFKKFECYASFIVAGVVTFAIYFIGITNTDIASIKSTLQNYTLYIAAALLGMLGFLVGGLAIISGTVSNKVAQTMNKAGAFDALLSVMFSFYYEGAVIGALIFLYFVAYLALSIGWVFNFLFIKILILVFAFLLSYGLSFAVCFAVSLLGTCINMFIINYNFSCNASGTDDNFEQFFISLRVDALTSLLVNKTIVTQAEFIEAVRKRIDEDCPEKIRDAMHQKMCIYYSITPDREPKSS